MTALISAQDQEQAILGMKKTLKYDHAFICAFFRYLEKIPQDQASTVGPPEYQRYQEEFSKLLTALLRHSTAPDQQDASLSIAETMACGRVCAKLAAFRRLSFKLLNRQMFMTCEFTKYVWNTRAEEIGLDYEPFCEACEMFAPLVNCLLRYNKQEKQRFQIGLLSPDAELTAYLRPNEWIPAGMSYNTIFNEYDQTFGDPALLPIRVSVRALQGHSASLRVNASSIMEPITCSEDLQSDVFLVHGTFFKAWKIMDPTSPDVDNYEYSILRRDGGPGNNRESRRLHFLPARVLKDQPQAMRRNCDILLVFCASDLLRVALEAASDLDYQNMLHSGGRDNQDVLPHTMWRAANGCVCGDFDVKLGENLLGAYDVRRRKWLLDDPFIRDKDNANMIRSPIAAYVAYWQHQNPDVPALNTGRPESEDRSRSRDPRPPGSRTGPSAQRDPGWGKRQLERTRSHYLGPVLGRERRSPSAGVRENTPDFGARARRDRSPAPGAVPVPTWSRSRPEATSQPSRSSQSVRRVPTMDSRRPLERTRLRATFREYSEEQDYTPSSPAGHVQRSRSPDGRARSRPGARRFSDSRTAPITLVSRQERTERAREPGRTSGRSPARGFYRGRSERSQTPARERRASTPRRTVRESTPTSEIPREGYNHENVPDEVLEFWNSRPRPSDMELRNPVLLERPGQPICDLCGRDTSFFSNLCSMSTCGFCRITFKCDCSERWLSLGETLIRVFGTQETTYGREEDQQFTYEAAKEDHDSEQNRVVQRAHSQFRALRERVLGDPETTSGSGELDRLIRDDDRSAEEPYAVYGNPNDPLPTAVENIQATKVQGSFPIVRFAGLTSVHKNSSMEEKQRCLDIMRNFFVSSPLAVSENRRRMRSNNSLTQTDTAKVEFTLFNWGSAVQKGTLFPGDEERGNRTIPDFVDDLDVRGYLMFRNSAHIVTCCEAAMADYRAIADDNAIFGMQVNSLSGAPSLFLGIRGCDTSRIELIRVRDQDKEGNCMTICDDHDGTWCVFACTFRIIWGLKADAPTLVDTAPMLSTGERMTMPSRLLHLMSRPNYRTNQNQRHSVMSIVITTFRCHLRVS